MKLEVFDPAMCCSTGVCGPSVPPALARFAGDLEWLAGKGVEVRRYNLTHEPQAFVASDAAARGARRARRGGAAADPRRRRAGLQRPLPLPQRARRLGRRAGPPAPRDRSRWRRPRAAPEAAAAAAAAADDRRRRAARRADARAVLHRQGRRGQDHAGVRDRGRARRRAAGACCSSAPTRPPTSTRCWARALAEQPPSGARRAGAVRGEHRSRSGRARLPRARRRPLPRPAARHRGREHGGAACRAPARSRSRPSTSSPRLLGDPEATARLRPRHLRHRADRPHAAAARAARRVDRVHRHQHLRHVVPGPAGRPAGRSATSTPPACSALGDPQTTTLVLVSRPEAIGARRGRAHPRRARAAPACAASCSRSTASLTPPTATTPPRWRSPRARPPRSPACPPRSRRSSASRSRCWTSRRSGPTRSRACSTTRTPPALTRTRTRSTCPARRWPS